jgi:hypothetical protein
VRPPSCRCLRPEELYGALWGYLSDRFPIGGRDAADAGWQAGVLLLALMASGSTEQAIAQLLTGLGWALEGGRPIDRRTVIGLVTDDARMLRRVSALGGDRLDSWPGQVTAEGVRLAQAAMADEHSGTRDRGAGLSSRCGHRRTTSKVCMNPSMRCAF